jgi:glycosyltransferase involved in cell wall biosynthesis
MPIYNAEKYLALSIGSIIEQTFDDWELICVNDGSRDASGKILNELAAAEPRLRLLEQENLGLVAALQNGIAQARGTFLARMDADDIAMPERFEKQVRYLNENPEVAVVGGAALEIDEDSDPLRLTSYPNDHDQLVHRLLHRETALIHPSVMMRSDILRATGGYRSKFQWIEDHDLWLRISKLGKLANLPDVVLAYRQHASSICWQRSNAQRELMNQLLLEAYADRGLECPASYIVETSKVRSKAGSGKWARMAARGGYGRTAIKHLRTMWQEPSPLGYKLRMTADSLVRLPGGIFRACVREKSPTLPKLPIWRNSLKSSHSVNAIPSRKSA